MTSPAAGWGTTPDERERAYPCDRFVPEANDAYYRGVTVDAPAAIIFRWLCQLRVAPYSYDRIDNRGRRSPRKLTPGLDELAVGQRVMSIFKLLDFERDRHITIGFEGSRLVGDVAVSYVVVQESDDRCRLLVKLRGRRPRGPVGWVVSVLMPWGDLIMMRRQLLNLKQLAEETAARVDANDALQ